MSGTHAAKNRCPYCYGPLGQHGVMLDSDGPYCSASCALSANRPSHATSMRSAIEADMRSADNMLTVPDPLPTPTIAPLHLSPYRLTFTIPVPDVAVIVQWDCLIPSIDTALRCGAMKLDTSGAGILLFNPAHRRWEVTYTGSTRIEWDTTSPANVNELLDRLPAELVVIGTKTRSKDLHTALQIRLPHVQHELIEE